MFHIYKNILNPSRPLYGNVEDSIIPFEQTLEVGKEISLPTREGNPDIFHVTHIEQTENQQYGAVVYLMKKMPLRDTLPPNVEIWGSSGINYVEKSDQLLLEERMALFGI